MVIDLDGTGASRSATGEASGRGIACTTASLEEGLCSWLHRAQARAGRADAHRGLSLAHSYQWLGSFGNRGNGLYREELRRGLSAIGSYLEAHHLSPTAALLRLDGQYGTGALITDLAGFPFVMRGKDYSVLDQESVQSRLHPAL